MRTVDRLAGVLPRVLLLVANREMGHDLKSKEGASDLVQETLLEAYRDLGRFTGGPKRRCEDGSVAC